MTTTAEHYHGTTVVEKKGLLWAARVDMGIAWTDSSRGLRSRVRNGRTFHSLTESRARVKAREHFLTLMFFVRRERVQQGVDFHWSADFV